MSRHDALRTKFLHGMSQLYRTEVPLYRQLVKIVQKQNHLTTSDLDDGGGRFEVKRQGAIRLGTPQELHIISRVFGPIWACHLVDTDLSSTGIPLHATAFRPTTAEALSINPFRVFTTVLRVDMLSENVRELTSSILSKRSIFGLELAKILDTMENKLQSEHPILSDNAAFSTAHINHLTLRAVDITAVQKDMTSSMAVGEAMSFLDEDADNTVAEEYRRKGLHRAQFGEVEQRGAATTRRGVNRYNLCLEKARARAAAAAEIVGASYEEITADEFKDFPGDCETPRRQGLVFFQYRLADRVSEQVPIVYEDFLPISAAGIFLSNLDGQPTRQQRLVTPRNDREDFERVLGKRILDEIDQYEYIQEQSVQERYCALGMD
ncbi:hypothetical protein NM208_g14478 [Fusarium decemcellulare]|uniref:Uncharacterized protein n=1 Tax=Fusarium decemcellulare TaxID=57161 RepID=A0ACC1RJD5_9HYPO|nr:hypothetical protein NM208_g14478 [Fusarium decemcellulare]